jgi:hypothetical protein
MRTLQHPFWPACGFSAERTYNPKHFLVQTLGWFSSHSGGCCIWFPLRIQTGLFMIPGCRFTLDLFYTPILSLARGAESLIFGQDGLLLTFVLHLIGAFTRRKKALLKAGALNASLLIKLKGLAGILEFWVGRMTC